MISEVSAKNDDNHTDKCTLMLSDVYNLISLFSAHNDDNFKKYKAILDTASNVCTIPRTICNKLKVNLFRNNNFNTLYDFDNQKHSISGDIAPVWVNPLINGSKKYLINFLVLESGDDIIFNLTAASRIFKLSIHMDNHLNLHTLYDLSIEAIYNRVTPTIPEPILHKIPKNITILIDENKFVSGKCTHPDSSYSLPRYTDDSSICSKAKPKFYRVPIIHQKTLDEHIESLISTEMVKLVPPTHTGFQIM